MVRKQPNHGYVARPTLWPDEAAYGATTQEVLDNVQTLIRDLLNQTQLMQVEVEVPGSPMDDEHSSPWLAKAGVFAHDPTWDSFQQAMADYRRKLDEQQTPEMT